MSRWGLHLRTTYGYRYTDKDSVFRPIETALRKVVCGIYGHAWWQCEHRSPPGHSLTWKCGCARCGKRDPLAEKDYKLREEGA